MRPLRLLQIGLRVFLPRLWRMFCLALSLQIALLPALPAWSQVGSAEPEVNPQFQNSLQQNSGAVAGGPLASAPSPGIQIGASAPMRPHRPSAPTPALETRISIRVKNAPLATFLDAISAQAQINFIITEGLESRRVTAFLQHVTVREALQVLLEIKGLTYQQIGKSNTYVVTKRSQNAPNLITRIYTLSYIPLVNINIGNAAQSGMTGQRGMTGMGGSSGASALGGGSRGGYSGGAAGLAPNQGGSLVGMGGMGGSGGAMGGMMGMPGMTSGGISSIVTVVQSVLTRAGRVAIDPRTNSLIVTDVPDVFPQVDQLIAELDKKVPQVMIEAQIVEIDSARANDLGFEWGGSDGELAQFTGGKRDTSFPMVLSSAGHFRFFDPLLGLISSVGQSGGGGTSGGGLGGSAGGVAGATGGLSLLQPATLGVNPLTGLPTTGSYATTSVLNLTQLSVIFRALVSRSEARFLGKPKILTINNTPATIEISADSAVGITQDTTGGGAGITQSSVQPERYDTGLTLQVTPQVNKDGYITMQVDPKFTDVQPSVISSPSNPFFDPTTRSASTLVRVKNGETLVLGGLLHSTESKIVRKVPFLGYIPIIGWLFTSTQASRKNTDLVIFITPTIVND